jgi:hypothetical protein
MNNDYGWQDIRTAPLDGTEVLVFGYGKFAVASWYGHEWRDVGDIGWAGMYGDDGNQPTHWKPLIGPSMDRLGQSLKSQLNELKDKIAHEMSLAMLEHMPERIKFDLLDKLWNPIQKESQRSHDLFADLFTFSDP